MAHLRTDNVMLNDGLLQRQEKYTELRQKSVKARNEYLLTVEASNAATKKYFEEDLSLIVDVSELE